MNEQSATKLRQQLARLARKHPDVFGADSHDFEVNEPLSEREVAKFERKHGIALPAEYRWFITNVGNGGAGPFYGVFAFGEMDDNSWSEEDGFVGTLSRPFPHTGA